MTITKFLSEKKILSIISKLPIELQIILRRIMISLSPVQIYKSRRTIDKYFASINSSTSNNDDMYIWNKAFKKHMLINPKNLELAISFFQVKLETIKLAEKDVQKDHIILLCVVKNDLERIKLLYDHYREIGIKHFVMIDNNSDDGTREWLYEQPDTDVYLIKETFSSLKKYGWINRVLNIYGFDRWYLYVDSDELFVYQDVENKSINDLVNYAEKENLSRVGSVMLDMYSNKGLFKVQAKGGNIREEYIYFDSDSYIVSGNYKGGVIKGGPRDRCLNTDNNGISPLLIKHPLFKFKKGDIFESAHYIYPYKCKTSIISALLHYKFLETDLMRYKTIAAQGIFSGGSREYKQYMASYELNKSINFMYNGSIKYINSSSLRNINFISDIAWKEEGIAYSKRKSGS